ncbi:tail fiber domain-containing protein, partial [Escherichia coli]|uniref:tail fiber domain-containing protein n=1 Tax=Escherichia coli TaxID=562 RepID=UPI003EE22F60
MLFQLFNPASHHRRFQNQSLFITDTVTFTSLDGFAYQNLDRIEVKGKDGARWHFGAVAQHVISVFQNEGIDVSRLAFIC